MIKSDLGLDKFDPLINHAIVGDRIKLLRI
jgi:hypothetical protein